MAQSYLGEAAIKIGADTSSFDKSLKDTVERSAPSTGERFAHGFGKTIKRGLYAAGAVGAAAFGFTLKKGFDRLVALDTARGQFKGLGLDVEKTMEQVGKGVTDTSLSMAQGAGIAVAAMATGNLPLEKLEAQIKRVSNVSAAYGLDAEHAGLLLNNVLTKNKVTWGDLSQMVKNNIPIVSMLAKEYGVSGEEIEKMVNTGKIGIEDLNRVIDENAGKAAEAYAGTWEGLSANISANIGKLGADILDNAFPQAKAGLEKFLALLKDPGIRASAASLGEHIGKAFTWVATLIVDTVIPKLTAFKDSVVGLWDKVKPVIEKVKDGLSGMFSGGLGLDAKSLGGGALVGLVAMFSGAFGKVSKIMGAFMKGLGPFGKAIGGIGKAFKFLTGPVGIAVALFTLAYASNEQFREAINNLLGVIFDLAGTLLQTLLPPIQTLIEAVLPVLMTAFEALVPVLTVVIDVFAGIVEWLAPFIAGAAKYILAIVGIVLAVKKVIAIFKILKGAFLAIKVLMAANPFGAIVLGIVALIIGLKALWENSETFRNIVKGVWEAIKNAAMAVVDWFTGTAVPWLQQAWETIKEGALILWDWIKVAWDGIMTAISAVVGWITDTAWPAIKSVFEAIGAVIEWVFVNLIRPQFIIWKTIIEAVVKWVKDTAWPWLKDVFDKIAAAAKWVYEKGIKPAWEGIKKAIDAVVNWLKNTAWPWIKDVWDKIVAGAKWLWENGIKPAWEGIKSAINAVIDWLKNTAWPWIKDVWDKIAAGAKWLWDNGIKPAWDGIKGAINAVVDWIKNTAWPGIKWAWDQISDGAKWLWENGIKKPFDNIKSGIDTVVDGFKKAKDAIGRAWDGLKDAVSAPIRSALDWINRNFINPANTLFQKLQMTFRLPTIGGGGSTGGRSTQGGPLRAMASGGVLPGYTPGRDVHEFIGRAGRLLLSGGEAIMRPEWTRAVGRRTIDAWNAASRRGPDAVRRTMGFADGGVIPTHRYWLGGAIDWLKQKGTDIIDVGKATVEALRDPIGFVKKMIERGLAGMAQNPLAQAARATITKTIDVIAQKIKSWAETDTEGGIGTATGAMGWRSIWSLIQTVAPEARMTSNYRPGAITASGFKSMHGMGRAVDLVSSNMMATFNKIRPLRAWSELYYSPAEWRQLLRGRPHRPTGITRANHFDHIHAAMASGGVLKPLLFDRGGVLPPGKSLVENRTGRPEPLTRADRTRPVTLHVYNPVSEPTEVTINRQMQRLALLGVT